MFPTKRLFQIMTAQILTLRDGGLLASGKLPVQGQNEALLIAGELTLNFQITLNFDSNKPINVLKLAKPREAEAKIHNA